MTLDSNRTACIISGVDPGLASGGMAILNRANENAVIGAASFVEKRGSKLAAKSSTKTILDSLNGWSDSEFTEASIRAGSWSKSFFEYVDRFNEVGPQIEVFAIESFVDQRSRAREEKQRLVAKRWHTPLVIGMIVAGLSDRGYTVENGGIVYQNAGVVIRQFSSEIAALAARKNKQIAVVEGDAIITNDHMRKAFAHALALSQHLGKALTTQGRTPLNA